MYLKKRKKKILANVESSHLLLNCDKTLDFRYMISTNCLKIINEYIKEINVTVFEGKDGIDMIFISNVDKSLD